MNDDFFAAPAFDPAAALTGLRRSLRELGLKERGQGPFEFELAGKPVARLAAADGALGQAIDAAIAKRPARSPEWQVQTLKNSADVRRYVEQLKRRRAEWTDDE